MRKYQLLWVSKMIKQMITSVAMLVMFIGLTGCNAKETGVVNKNIGFTAPQGWEYCGEYSSDDVAYYKNEDGDIEIAGWDYIEADGYTVTDETAYDIACKMNTGYLEYTFGKECKALESEVRTSNGFIGATSVVKTDKIELTRTTVFSIASKEMLNITMRTMLDTECIKCDTLNTLIESLKLKD